MMRDEVPARRRRREARERADAEELAAAVKAESGSLGPLDGQPSGAVGFAPGRYVRLKNSMEGLAAGARGMLSGEVLTRPEDRDKLQVVFMSYIPGSPDYGTLSVPREALEWDESELPSSPAMMPESAILGPQDEPQHSGAIVAVNYGDYRRLEIWQRSGANIGNWYCLGGEFGRPRAWDDPRTEMQKMMWNGPAPKPGPGEIPRHPHWEDVLARGPVTLLVPGNEDAYRAGWRNGRRRMVEQMETVADDDE